MLVKIFEDRFVPGIGHGPFNEPISITEDKYRLLKRMGVHVVKIQPSVVSMGVKAFKETYGNKKIEKSVEVEDSIKIENSIESSIHVEETVAKPIVEDKIDEVVEEIETTEDESIKETIEEPETVEEEENEETTEEVDVESLTKREIMSMLDEAGIAYSNTANKATLVSLLEEIQ